MKNILVTGCDGQLGKEIQIVAKNYPQFNYFFTNKNNLDITNEKQIVDFILKNNIECIINCAAYTNVDKAQEEMNKNESVNYQAVSYLAKAMNLVNGLLIHISSDYVYSNIYNRPLLETDETLPLSAYGWSKLKGERNAMSNCDKCIILRTSWLYSEFGKNFVKNMLKYGSEKEELGVVFDQIGTPTYALDLAETIFKIITSEHKEYGVFNYSNEGAISWYDFAKLIFIKNKLKCKLKALRTDEYPTPAKRPSYSVLNKTKIKKTYKIEIPNWYDSLEKCLENINEKDA